MGKKRHTYIRSKDLPVVEIPRWCKTVEDVLEYRTACSKSISKKTKE